MASKQKERELAAEQEAIESGMLARGGRGRRRTAERKASMDPGLNEAPHFSPGMMRVSKPQARPEASAGTVLGRRRSGDAKLGKKRNEKGGGQRGARRGRR